MLDLTHRVVRPGSYRRKGLENGYPSVYPAHNFVMYWKILKQFRSIVMMQHVLHKTDINMSDIRVAFTYYYDRIL